MGEQLLPTITSLLCPRKCHSTASASAARTRVSKRLHNIYQKEKGRLINRTMMVKIRFFPISIVLQNNYHPSQLKIMMPHLLSTWKFFINENTYRVSTFYIFEERSPFCLHPWKNTSTNCLFGHVRSIR